MPDTSIATDGAPTVTATRDDMVDGLLVQAGLRRTQATRAVLGWFVSDASRAATHAELETALQAQGLWVNRVTLYRLLDRLVATGLLARHADDAARTWRYAWATSLADDEGGLIPRFECDGCHRQFRLTEGSPPVQAAADELMKTLASLGHHGQRMDVSIHGTCAVCVEPAADGDAPR